MCYIYIYVLFFISRCNFGTCNSTSYSVLSQSLGVMHFVAVILPLHYISDTARSSVPALEMSNYTHGREAGKHPHVCQPR